MAFKTPADNTLTPNQAQALAQLSAMQNLMLNFPLSQLRQIDKSKQISMYDMLIKLAESTVGKDFIRKVLTMFVDQLFDTKTKKLETFLIKAIAKSLDKNNRHIGKKQLDINGNPILDNNGNFTYSILNEDWLNANVLPVMGREFALVKVLLVNQIMMMIFGPVQNMAPKNSQGGTNMPIGSPSANDMLNWAVCAENSFSLSNDANTDGDAQYNLVQLRQQLTNGNVVFTVSCQDVKIQLPQTIMQNIGNAITTANQGGAIQNPSVFFTQAINHVNSETQRINNAQNANAVSQTFQQNLVEKILKLITPALHPILSVVPITGLNNLTLFEAIFAGTQTAGGSMGAGINNGNDLLNATNPSPCTLAGMTGSNTPPAVFKQQSAFMTALINLIYSFLCTLLLQLLIIEIKKFILKALVKQATSKLQRKTQQQQQESIDVASALDKTGKILKQAQMAENALNKILPLFKYAESL